VSETTVCGASVPPEKFSLNPYDSAMPSQIFQLSDRRYLALALSAGMSHGDIDLYEWAERQQGISRFYNHQAHF
jgi:hypothetical protein